MANKEAATTSLDSLDKEQMKTVGIVDNKKSSAIETNWIYKLK